MAYALYRSKLVARFIPVLGLIGGPLVFAANVAVMFGVPRDDLGVLVIPIFAWEICLATFLILKGFRSPATTTAAPSEAQYPPAHRCLSATALSAGAWPSRSKNRSPRAEAVKIELTHKGDARD